MAYYNKYKTRQNFDKQKLFDFIDKFEIIKEGEFLTTKYDGRVIKQVTVSKIYEIFDFRTYLKDKIDIISENFKIEQYTTHFRGGVQEIRLFSEAIKIGNDFYEKCFFFLNSTDKSRVLSMNLGFYNVTKNAYSAFSKSEFSLHKKHYIGVTDAANQVSLKFTENTFNDEIESIKSLVGHNVSLSKLQECIIMGEDGEPTKSGHDKFDTLRKCLQKSYDGNKEFTTLKLESTSLYEKFQSNDGAKYDFYVDAYEAFVLYSQLFSNYDSYIVAKETDRILKITQQMVRSNKLDELFA